MWRPLVNIIIIVIRLARDSMLTAERSTIPPSIDTGVSHINENDLLDNNMTDWRLGVDLASKND